LKSNKNFTVINLFVKQNINKIMAMPPGSDDQEKLSSVESEE